MNWFEKIQFARKISNMSLRDVKEKTGISDSYLCQLENGEIENPSYFKIQKLLQLYNLSHDDIRDDLENPTRDD